MARPSVPWTVQHSDHPQLVLATFQMMYWELLSLDSMQAALTWQTPLVLVQPKQMAAHS